jgi:hypothetical protein
MKFREILANLPDPPPEIGGEIDSCRNYVEKVFCLSDKTPMATSMAVIQGYEHEPIAVRRTKTGTQIRAARLLDAWIAGDRRRLDYELKRWRSGDVAVSEGIDGRAELLDCLVQQMMDEPDLFAPRTARLHLGVWIDMLVHLAEPEPAFTH